HLVVGGALDGKHHCVFFSNRARLVGLLALLDTARPIALAALDLPLRLQAFLERPTFCEFRPTRRLRDGASELRKMKKQILKMKTVWCVAQKSRPEPPHSRRCARQKNGTRDARPSRSSSMRLRCERLDCVFDREENAVAA